VSRRWTYGSLVLVLALLVALPLRLLGRRPAPRHPAIRRYADRPPKIRLCPGLTIVTAVSQPLGDYESIKTVESIADGVVHLKYSSERTVQDLFDVEPHFERLTLRRGIRLEDVRSGTLYLEQFYPPLPEVIPGTTAIGTSAALLDSLKTKGEAPLGIFLGFNGAPGLDRSGHPNIYDFAVQATVRRVEVAPVMIPVLVDGERVALPTIHARGDFFGDINEFYFLDDTANAIALEYHLGVGAARAVSDSDAKMLSIPAVKAGSDRDVLKVTKIGTRCTGDGLEEAEFERALEAGEAASIYDIYFGFGSDTIREESEPRLREIATVLRRHPRWKIRIEGHTDAIGDSVANQQLSERRAAAVRTALVTRHFVDPANLTTAGFGQSRPTDTNATMEGRARNRRVELIRE